MNKKMAITKLIISCILGGSFGCGISYLLDDKIGIGLSFISGGIYIGFWLIILWMLDLRYN